MALYNRENGRLLKERLQSASEERVTLSFYKYHFIEDPQAFRDNLYRTWEQLGVLGRTYVASEGINSQISVPTARLEEFRHHLDSIPFLSGLRLNMAIQDDGKSFFKLRITVRRKIVADGIEDPTFDVTRCGQHVDALTFNRLASDPNTVMVDMRNHYESEVGYFKGAVRPDVDTFREELQVAEDLMKGKETQNLLLYCTGGIRCEKASAWMIHKGFRNVFQLEGGIINYTRQVKAQGLENKFIGKNFVFDERLGERITADIISSCHQCGAPCDDHTNCLNNACHLLFIQCPSCREKYSGCCSDHCKEVIRLPEEEQRALRKGVNPGQRIFRKSRSSQIRHRRNQTE